jgi:replicative DNA helicase
MNLAQKQYEHLKPEEQKRWVSEWDELYQETQDWWKQNAPKERMTAEEIHYLTLIEQPKFWAAETLKWICRDYQEQILHEMAYSKRTVLRLGRRLGKTETMCVIILWHAFTQPNRIASRGAEASYDILIIAPYEEQVDLIFKRLTQLIDASGGGINPSRDIEHHIELPNGTIIHGLTAGSKSGNGAANTRGQRGDLIVLDEVDYMNEMDITNIMNIRNESPETIRMVVASTPCGKRESYYKWCTEATVSYTYDEDQTAKSNRVMYKRTLKPHLRLADGTKKLNPLGDPIRDGNGWTTIHAPSNVNPELLKINIDTGLTYLEELRLDLTEMRYIQEVLAEFGESISGVFLKKHIDQAIEFGKEMFLDYTNQDFARNDNPRILGVDWDKSKADTNMVGMEWNREINKFVPFFRKVIPRGEFTYENAIKAIKEADKVFKFDYIMADAGHGENQIEQLRKWYMNNPLMGSPKKVVRLSLSEKVTIYDPVTRKAEKKHIKPFMVNNAVYMFERGMVVLNPNDRETIKQFEAYEVKSWGSDGRPTYTDVNEHILDCFVFCMFGFIKYFDDIMKVTKSVAIRAINQPLDRMSSAVSDRDIHNAEINEVKRKATTFARTLGLSSSARQQPTHSRRSMGMPSRKSW